ncbi:uncharacterized protein LOC110007313 [Amborella trichopoda]|uniref:uncharacterized protein LOC110007313 n=1 Tax=Amborella trichopoda TaxID=13333 RepID=UPI0009C16F52|nr:uncharacterized protein LOC110007313 [Amborella trichopoda]|eukprot:XP_020523186.1 uncharacterized protein LOC110007313 [Amborella trichopoda]
MWTISLSLAIPATITSLKQVLHFRFHLKDIELLKYFLGIEVARSKKGIYITQRKYTLEIIEEFGLLGARPIHLLTEQLHKLNVTTVDLLSNPTMHRRFIGQLIHLTITTPDIVYYVHILNQYMSQPGKPHLAAALFLVQYLKLSRPSDSAFQLRVFCDSDLASCLDTHRSTTEYFSILGNSLLSWKTEKQHMIPCSYVKAEYRVMASTSCEITWLRILLCDLGVYHSKPAFVFCDN